MTNGQQQVVKPQQIRDTLYVNFFSEVNPTSVSQLIGCIQQGLKQGKKKFCLFISSTGGNLMSGIAAYNFIKNIPNEIVVYNYGYVDSAAVLIFCAGQKRYSLPNSRFLFHEVAAGNIQGDKKTLQNNLNIINYDAQRYISIVSETTGKTKDKIEKDMSEQTILEPKEAQDYGLIHEIKETLPSLEGEESVFISVWPQPQQQK